MNHKNMPEHLGGYVSERDRGRAELLLEVVDHLREWAAHASRERDGRVVRNAANYLETRFGAGEADTRSPDNGSQDADQVVTDAPVPSDWVDRVRFTVNEDASITQAPSGVCEWEVYTPETYRPAWFDTSCDNGRKIIGESRFCPDCGRPVKIKED